MNGDNAPLCSVACPSCGQPLSGYHGGISATCSACGALLFLNGARGILHLLAKGKTVKGQAINSVKTWLSGKAMAPGLAKRAIFHHVELVYAPIYRFQAQLFYLGLGFQILPDEQGRDIRRSAEHRAIMPFGWAVPACSLSWNVPDATHLLQANTALFHQREIEPRARIFEPVHGEVAGVLEMARSAGLTAIRSQKWLVDINFERFASVHEELDLVFYPCWVVRYRFHNREYYAVVDGTNGTLMDGVAPSSDWFRATALMVTLAVPALTGSTILAGMPRGVSGAPVIFPLLTFIAVTAGLLPLMLAGFQVFRYGREIMGDHRRGGWRWLAQLIVEKYGDLLGHLSETKR